MKCDRDFTCDDVDILIHALRHQLDQIKKEDIRHNVVELLNIFLGLRQPINSVLSQTTNLPVDLQELKWIDDGLKALDGINGTSDDLHWAKTFIRLRMKVEEKLHDAKSLTP